MTEPTIAEVEALRDSAVRSNLNGASTRVLYALCDFWIDSHKPHGDINHPIFDQAMHRSTPATPPEPTDSILSAEDAELCRWLRSDNVVAVLGYSDGLAKAAARIEQMSENMVSMRKQATIANVSRKEAEARIEEFKSALYSEKASRNAADARAEAAERDTRNMKPMVNAAITWAFCPATGGYEYSDDDQGDYSIEGTCEALGEAVRQYTGLDENTPPDKSWTYAEMRAAIDAALAAGPAGDKHD